MSEVGASLPWAIVIAFYFFALAPTVFADSRSGYWASVWNGFLVTVLIVVIVVIVWAVFHVTG